jgi:hypothetical protein
VSTEDKLAEIRRRQKLAQIRERQQAAAEPAPEKEAEPWYEDLAEGVAVSGMELGYGLKDLVTDLSDEDRATLKDWQEDAGESGWGTAGQVLGEVAQFAVPGGAVVRAASKLPRLAKTAALAGEVGTAALLGSARLPEEGKTRAQEAKEEAIGATAGGLVGGILNKTLRGIRKTPEAQRLLDAGIDVTPGKAAANKTFAGLEAVAEVAPVLARGTKAAQRRAGEQFNERVLQRALAPGQSVDDIGTAGVRQLKEGFEEAYANAWSGATGLSNASRKEFVDTAVDAMPTLGKKNRNILKNIMADFKALTANPTQESLKNFDKTLRDRLSASRKDYDMRQLVGSLRDSLRAGMPEGVATSLKAVDDKYPAFLTVQRASKNAAAEGGEFVPSQLMSAVKAIGGDSAGTGQAALQDIATDATMSLGRKGPGQPLEWFRRIAEISPSPPGMRTAGRTLMGETSPQKRALALSELLRRYGISGAGTGAALEQ